MAAGILVALVNLQHGARRAIEKGLECGAPAFRARKLLFSRFAAF